MLLRQSLVQPLQCSTFGPYCSRACLSHVVQRLNTARYWVEQAKPPEDYLYENLHYSRVARYIRMVRQTAAEASCAYLLSHIQINPDLKCNVVPCDRGLGS